MSIRLEELATLNFTDVVEQGAPDVMPTHPGQMLMEDFLQPLGITQYRLAKEIGVPAQRVGEIIAGRRGISADTDLRLCRFFGLSDGWWLRVQADHDTRTARARMAEQLARITPWAEAAG